MVGDNPIVRLVEVEFSQLRPYVCLGYFEDEDLLHRFAHKKHESFDAMVDVNMETIQADIDSGTPLHCYVVMLYYEPIGFTVLLNMRSGDGYARMLRSFAISLHYRKRPILQAWMKAIADRFDGEPYCIVLSAQNNRAAAFFEKFGFVDKSEQFDGQSGFDKSKNIFLWQQSQ